jgi:hypothetical protein
MSSAKTLVLMLGCLMPIWGCIQKITPQVGQVLQASHKELEAESRVEI